MKLKSILVGVSVILLGIVRSYEVYSTQHAKFLIDKIIAQVNDDVITQSELETILRNFPEHVHQQVMRNVLDSLIDRQLLLQEAQRRGIVVATSTVLNYLATTSPTEAQLHYARQQIMLELLSMKLLDQITVPQWVVEQIYQKTHKQLLLYQIVSNDESTALLIRKQLMEGVEISSIENKYEGVSIEKLKDISPIQFPPLLAAEIEKLHQPNQLTDVIKTDVGFFLFQLIEKRNTPQDQYRQLIHEYIHAYKETFLNYQLNTLLNSLREKAYIKIIE